MGLLEKLETEALGCVPGFHVCEICGIRLCVAPWTVVTVFGGATMGAFWDDPEKKDTLLLNPRVLLDDLKTMHNAVWERLRDAQPSQVRHGLFEMLDQAIPAARKKLLSMFSVSWFALENGVQRELVRP